MINKRSTKPNPGVKQDRQAPSKAGCILGNYGIDEGFS